VNPGEKRALIFALGSFLLGILLIFAGRLALHSRPVRPEDFPRTEETYIKRVNLNTATAAELENLPGIGPKTAERIIELRETRGKFTGVEDLLEIKGMSEKKLEAIKPFIEVK
jgi:comEA protein